MSDTHQITWLGDSAVVVEFEARIEAVTNDRALALARAMGDACLTGVRDVVPSYRAVTVHFDPLRTDVAALVERLAREAESPAAPAPETSALVRIPVCYGGAFGPDLTGVAAWSGLSEEQVVARHVAATYRVFMLGFLPGFAYLGKVDPQIAMPRRGRPRVKVAAGSVGIAGEQTGVYPRTSPGGWQIIGRTPMRLLDLSSPEPFLLGPGDLVRFYAIDAVQFSSGDRDAEAAA